MKVWSRLSFIFFLMSDKLSWYIQTAICSMFITDVKLGVFYDIGGRKSDGSPNGKGLPLPMPATLI